MATLSKKIAEARRNKGFTQEGFAKKLNIDSGTVARWEQGTRSPTISKLQKIAEILEVPAGVLLGDSTEHKTQTARDLDELVRELARQNPDLTLRFRDIVRNFDKYSPKTQKTIADGMSYVLGLVDDIDEYYGMEKESRHGKI